MESSNEPRDQVGQPGGDFSDDSSGSESPDDSDSGKIEEESASPRRALHVSVQRGEISSTQVQEANDELQGLGVDAYDQQIYEQSVFNQVNKVVTNGPSNNDHAAGGSRGREKINDLMRLIHDSDEEQTESRDRDEQILELTRQERLNRARVKLEHREQFDGPSESDHKPHKPITVKQEYCFMARVVSPQPSTSRSQPQEDRKPILGNSFDDDTDETDKSDDDSNEYRPDPVEESDDDFSESAEFEPDEPENVVSIKKFKESKKIRDDGDVKYYASRIKAYNRAKAQERLNNILDDGTEFVKLDELVRIEGNLKVPKDVWDNLFEHQKTGVKWLWELHQLGTGGILGDEMGLGKTIQMIAFLVALRSSNIIDSHRGYENLGPTVLVCPATVMHQWLVEFRKWFSPFRVAILHSTGNFEGDRKNLVRVIHKSRGILICSFQGVVIYQDYLHALDWHYAILDEGHKIRNPDAQVTLACKRFRTPHRIILSGSPVQNNLRELWSIFDYIYPGKLGTLPVFMSQFSIPITQGGYANATDMQVQIAYKCACVLRDTIKPFLLRRTKAEVNNKLKLPERSEQVLFCKLTDNQRKCYESFLNSPTVRDIKRGTCQIFVGLIQLRKICNHPDLFDASECFNQMRQTKEHREKKLKHLEFFSVDETYGHYKKSGKMMVVDALLKLWSKQEQKVLLFTQSRQMLSIFQNYMKENNHRYLTMDGSTPISTRHSIVEEFNNNPEIFIFLLTTRVGGVGVNLIGANRIIIYDPDWNPSTDIQARERAWRIGQKRHVIIYRLLTAGTIEEKIYHRQVFKLYLTNRVLKDAKQKRFFKTNDLHELFTLGTDDKNIETQALFDDDVQINKNAIKKRKKKRKKMKLETKNSSKSLLSEHKIQEMREKARRISQMITSQYGNATTAANQTDCGASPTEEVLYCPGGQPDQPPACENVLLELKRQKALKKTTDFLVRQATYKPDKTEDQEKTNQEDYILERLFKKAGISGALQHDRIESDATHDIKIVESEAERVARDAIRALRESRRSCLSYASGIPNWTGRSGSVAAAPRLQLKNKSRAKQMINQPNNTTSGEPSLLSSIKQRNRTNPVQLHSDVQNYSLDSDEDEGDKDFEGKAKESGADDIAAKLRDFVIYKSASGNGEAQTDELLQFFKENFQTDKTAFFKAILYKMCEFQRRGDKGFWKLRSEFRA